MSPSRRFITGLTKEDMSHTNFHNWEKKRIIFTLILLIFTILNSFSQDGLSKLFESTLPSIVKIETFDSENRPLMSGTGFFIDSNGKAISNLHLFKGAATYQLTTSERRIFKIKNIWHKNDSLDLVLFDIYNDNETIFPYLKKSTFKPRIGENVFTIGNPIGMDFSISNGIISSIRNLLGSGQIIQTSAPISPGSSGSPLLNMNGTVIGVITFTIGEGQNLNFAISLIDKNLEKDFLLLDKNSLLKSYKNDDPAFSDKYVYARGSHLEMCKNWRFNLDYLKKMSNAGDFKWPVKTLSRGQLVPLESYVRSYHEGNLIGTTILFSVDNSLAYVVSYGFDMGDKSSQKTALLLVSRIKNGEDQVIFNQVVEKKRVNNNNNLFLEDIGNPKIGLAIEDQVYVRTIYLEDSELPIQSLKVYHLENYDLR